MGNLTMNEPKAQQHFIQWAKRLKLHPITINRYLTRAINNKYSLELTKENILWTRQLLKELLRNGQN